MQVSLLPFLAILDHRLTVSTPYLPLVKTRLITSRATNSPETVTRHGQQFVVLPDELLLKNFLHVGNE